MRCEGRGSDRWSTRCYRDATTQVDGRWFCGPHAAGAKRSAVHRAAVDTKIKTDTQQRTELLAQADRLSTALGTEVRPHYEAFPKGRYTGKMVVSAEFLESLARVTTR